MKKDNSGALFKNDKKEDEKHPDYKGNATIDGNEYWVSAWINEAKSGAKYMSLSFSPKAAKQEPSYSPTPLPADMKQDDEIPF